MTKNVSSSATKHISIKNKWMKYLTAVFAGSTLKWTKTGIYALFSKKA